MDCTKIMSKEWKPTKEEVEQYLLTLVEKLNVRLLSGEMRQNAKEKDAAISEWERQVMWVESITLTDYTMPPEKSKK